MTQNNKQNTQDLHSVESTMLAINGAGSTRGFYRDPTKTQRREINQQPMLHLIFFFNYFFFREIRTVFQQSSNFFHVFPKTNRKQVRTERILAGNTQRSADGFSCERFHLMGSSLLLVMSMQVLPFSSEKAGTDTYRITLFLREESVRCAKVVFW